MDCGKNLYNKMESSKICARCKKDIYELEVGKLDYRIKDYPSPGYFDEAKKDPKYRNVLCIEELMQQAIRRKRYQRCI
jgi:hypothetical protein